MWHVGERESILVGKPAEKNTTWKI